MLIDTHVHLTDTRYDEDRTKLINELKENNLEAVINVGYDFESSKEGFALSQKHNEVYVALGIHPSNAEEYNEEFEAFVTEVAQNNKVIAIGEIGLDYYRGKETKKLQKEVFVKQLKLANKFNLPVIIHVRDAYEDALSVLQQNKHLLNNSGVMHCYGGSLEYAREVLKLGLYFGFDGPITFKNSHIAQKILKHLPKEKVLIETDCPYLTPHPYRGQRNEPKYVDLVVEKMAESFNVTKEECILLTNNNAKTLFKKLGN